MLLDRCLHGLMPLGTIWISPGKLLFVIGRYIDFFHLKYDSDFTANLEHIGHVVRMSVSRYKGRRFEPRQQYVVSVSRTLYPHCCSRLSCEMSTRWGQPREGCSVL